MHNIMYHCIPFLSHFCHLLLKVSKLYQQIKVFDCRQCLKFKTKTKAGRQGVRYQNQTIDAIVFDLSERLIL